MAKTKTAARERVYKKIDLVGTSSKSFENAIENAVHRAAETLTNLSWFEVKELRGAIRGSGVFEYQAVIAVSFEVQ